MKKVSVIIPVYKVEEFLTDCVESVINQTYTNLEIILVDDGSPDKCGEMCDDFQKKDKRIRVIHKDNGGQSSARNAGLRIAEGEYVTFVDSDDFIHPQMIEILAGKISEENADLAMGFISLTENRTITYDKDLDGSNYSIRNREEYWHMNYEGAFFSARLVMCPAKLYKRALISQIIFPEGMTHEDVMWAADSIKLYNKVLIFPYDLYFYYQREGSTMHTRSLKNVKDEMDACYYFTKKLAECFPEFISLQYGEFQKSYYKNLYKINYLQAAQAKELKRYFCDRHHDFSVYLQTISLGQKLLLLCMRLLPVKFIRKMSDYHFDVFEYMRKWLNAHLAVKGEQA